MTKIPTTWIGNFDKIKNEDDLKLKPGQNINPPPGDGRCDCCGRHISELKPFGGPGDPLVGDFTGAFLVKGYRNLGFYNEEGDKAQKEAAKCYIADGFGNIYDWMIYKYGIEKGEDLYYANEGYNQYGSSWECRDCMVLDMKEYFKKLEHWSK